MSLKQFDSYRILSNIGASVSNPSLADYIAVFIDEKVFYLSAAAQLHKVERNIIPPFYYEDSACQTELALFIAYLSTVFHANTVNSLEEQKAFVGELFPKIFELLDFELRYSSPLRNSNFNDLFNSHLQYYQDNSFNEDNSFNLEKLLNSLVPIILDDLENHKLCIINSNHTMPDSYKFKKATDEIFSFFNNHISELVGIINAKDFIATSSDNKEQDQNNNDKTIDECVETLRKAKLYEKPSEMSIEEYKSKLRKEKEEKESLLLSNKQKKIPLSNLIFTGLIIVAIVLLIVGIVKLSEDNSDTVSITQQKYTTSQSRIVTTTQSRYIEYEEPKSGQFLFGTITYNNCSELTIKASSTESCVVKLKDRSGYTVYGFYVRAGDKVTVNVPRERLYVYFASGETWYGRHDLFGEYTSYSKDSTICNFEEYTYEYTLYPVSSGNFSETPISADEF